MPAFYPSVICNILLRYDETLQIVNLPGLKQQGGEVPTGLDVLPAEQPDAISSAQHGPNLEDLIKVTGTKDTASRFNSIVPKSASVEMSGYRTAGTFSVQVRWRELPIDPRMARAALVQVYQGTVNPDDFATGMIRLGADGERVAVLRPTEDNLVMTGLVDGWKVTHDTTGSWVTFEGRDLRGLLLDSPVNPKVLNALKYDQPLDAVLKQLIETHPLATAGYFKGPNIDKREWPEEKIPSPYDNEIRPSRGASGKGGKVGSKSGTSNYWDIITNLCFRVGAIPYMENQTLVVRPARSIFKRRNPSHASWSPFRDRNGVPAPRKDENGDDFFVRRMVYGRNIEQLQLERKFTGVKVPVIECISTDHSGSERGIKKLLKVQIPSKAELAKLAGSVSPDGQTAQTEVLKVPVPGVRSLARLKEIAIALYEEIGQGELGGSVKSKNLSSFLGAPKGSLGDGEWPVDADNADPDLLTMRPGDAVEIAVDIRQITSRSPLASELVDHHRRDFNEQVDAILVASRTNGASIDINTARVLVASARSQIVDNLNTFRCRNITFNWMDGKVDINFDFHNYFIARYGGVAADLRRIDAELKPPPTRNRRKRPVKQVAPKRTAPPLTVPEGRVDVLGEVGELEFERSNINPITGKPWGSR